MIRKQAENGDIARDPPLLYYIQGLRTGLRPNRQTSSEFVSGALLGFYVANGFIGQARQVFDEMPQPGLVLWTLMIRAYVCLTLPGEAVELFRMMRRVGVMPDMVTVATVVSASSLLGDLVVAKTIHCFIEKSGVKVDAFVSSSLINM